MPPSLWSGTLRLSLVLIPVKLHSAVSAEDAVAFRMIHEPSGKPIKYVKGVRDGDTFTEVPEEEIVKGYEHAKGHHVLIHPQEIDELKLEAKHTIDLVRFVAEDEIDSRFWEKPYYLTPDGDDADEGYTVIREALKQTKKVAIGQLIIGGRGHLVGIKPHGKGLMLSILRYAHEVRDAAPYFERIVTEPQKEAVSLAKQLIEKQSGKFDPKSMPDEYALAVREYLQAKVENREPAVIIENEQPRTAVINIMDALKKSMQKQGQTKVRETVRKRMGKVAAPRSPANHSVRTRTASKRRELQ